MDNIQVTAGTGTQVAADDISGVLYQRVKISVGEDGTGTDLSSTNPMPVSDNGDSLTVDGTFLTDTELRASDVAITLDGEEVAVTGPLTDTELRAADVVVSLDGEEVAVTGPLTDTELRASDVAITLDGEEVAVTGGFLTDTELRASDVAITLDGEEVIVIEKVVPLTTVTGTVNSSGDTELIAAPGASTRIVVTEITIQLEGSVSTTVLFKSASTTIRRWLLPALGQGISWVFDQGREPRLGTNEALNINLSGANTVGYTVRYHTESV